MRSFMSALAAILATATVTAAASMLPASASPIRPLTAKIGSVRCTSHHWLMLWSSEGETCYLGVGPLVVRRPGVYKAQISVNHHRVCLIGERSGKSVSLCKSGAGELKIKPSMEVRMINIIASQAIPTPKSNQVSPARHISVRLMTGGHADPSDAAHDSCATHWAQANVYTGMGHVKVAWVKMTTHYCWNGVPVGPDPKAKVTSHSTSIKVGVTQPGQATGWSYVQNVTGIVFNCYVASESKVKCSGNTEYDQVEFQECLTKLGCGVATAYPWVQEKENYRGSFYPTVGNQNLP